MSDVVHEVGRPDDYAALLGEIRGLLQAARNRAYQAVDNIKVQAYWQVGERIVRAELEHKERADYGARAIEQLARDLGLARRTLYEIVQFYRTYPLVHMLRAELSWSQYVLLIRVEDARERGFYEIQAARNGWGVRELDDQIRAGLYGRTAREGIPPPQVAETLPATRPEDAFRGVFHFEVPGLPAGFSEAELEHALLANLEASCSNWAMASASSDASSPSPSMARCITSMWRSTAGRSRPSW